MRRFKKSSHAGRLFCLLLILCGVFFVFDASGHSLLAPASKVITDIFAPLYHLTADDTAHDQDYDVSDLSGQLYRRIEQLEIQIAALAAADISYGFKTYVLRLSQYRRCGDRQ